mgnify:CR=1 FL=1
MGQGATGNHEWTTKELVRETVSNFESLEGVDAVEWVTNGCQANIQDLIRVRTRRGTVLSLAITCYVAYGSAAIFDEAFLDMSR